MITVSSHALSIKRKKTGRAQRKDVVCLCKVCPLDNGERIEVCVDLSSVILCIPGTGITVTMNTDS